MTLYIVLLQCLVTVSLLVIKDVYVLINYVSFVEALFTLISVSGLLWLRYKRPNAQRPIKVSIYIFWFENVILNLLSILCYSSIDQV